MTLRVRMVPLSATTSATLRLKRTFRTAECSKNAVPRRLASPARPIQARYGSSANASDDFMPPAASSRIRAWICFRVNHATPRPAAWRASYSRLRIRSSSAPATTSSSCGASWHLMPSRRISAAPSSAPRRHISNTRRAALRPYAPEMSRNDGPGSGLIKPALRPLRPRPIRSCSSRTVSRPATAHTYAHAQPVNPPPTMTTSAVRSPRYVENAGTRELGNS